jgi:hypothetical protein
MVSKFTLQLYTSKQFPLISFKWNRPTQCITIQASVKLHLHTSKVVGHATFFRNNFTSVWQKVRTYLRNPSKIIGNHCHYSKEVISFEIRVLIPMSVAESSHVTCICNTPSQVIGLIPPVLQYDCIHSNIDCYTTACHCYKVWPELQGQAMWSVEGLPIPADQVIATLNLLWPCSEASSPANQPK